MDELRKALETFALRNAEGDVSDAVLEKACEAYKARSEFVDDYEYSLYVTKSLYDHLHGIEQDPDIVKAIMPGQTKVVDGVVYIWTLTPNAKTTYDWRVYKNPQGIPVGKGAFRSKVMLAQQEKEVNEMFPADPSQLTFVQKLGGSTGAVLMKDAKGREFVVKSSKNTNRGHVAAEYYAAQVYSLLGLDTPDYELYDDGTDLTLISNYMRGMSEPQVKDYDAMAKGFVVDAFLANWDVYQNDNCLVDAAGKVYRVDNGSAFNYRAQGAKKPFNDQIDWDGMVRYNPSIIANLKPQDFIDQIDALKARKEEILAFFDAGRLASKPKMRAIIEARFKDLDRIRGYYEVELRRTTRQVKPRTLKSQADMYREFTEDEVNDFWQNQDGGAYYRKLQRHGGDTGWELLSTICAARGFDARPDVVDDAAFWAKAALAKYHMFRGVAPRGSDKNYFADDFKYNDACYYGTVGIYGEGIYFHVNDSSNADRTPSGYKKTSAYHNALGYAGAGAVIEACLEDDAKVITVADAMEEVRQLAAGNSAALKAAQAELDNAKAEYDRVSDELENLTDNTKKQVKSSMHWDDASYIDIPLQIDQIIDWGAIDDDGNPAYMKFDDFMDNHLRGWVTANGGTITEKGNGTGDYVIKMPNTAERFVFSRYRYENDAIKRKNGFARPYNYPVRQFKEWIMREHYGKIEDAVEEAVNNLGDEIKRLQGEQRKAYTVYQDKRDAVSKINVTSVGDPDKDIYAAIYKSVHEGHDKEPLGVYAALKGYDALIQPNGNYCGNSFMIVLNRSKIITRK